MSVNPSDSGISRQFSLIDAALRQVESVESKNTVDGGPHYPEGSTQASPSRDSQPTLPARRGVRSIQGYQIESEIHRGGQGAVFRAKQESTGKMVAIKVILGGRFAGPQQLARFDREVRIMANIRHPGVVTIHDGGMVDGVPYYVMDLIEGKRLDQYVSDAQPSTRETLQMFVDVCSAVHAAHLHGVIHRDLKPGNILVDHERRIHVLDFGLAKLINDADDAHAAVTQTGQFIGSLPWASPEQASGEGDAVDLRTDIYSLGVILYQLLTRIFPYSVTGSPKDIIEHITNQEPRNPRVVQPQLDDDVATIVLKSLEKDRDRRYQSAGALADDLRRYLDGEPIDAKRSSLIYLVSKRIARHKWLAALAALSVISLLAGLIASTALWQLASRRAALAQRNAVRAETIQEFLAETLASANSLAGGQADITVREVIDKSVRQLDERPMTDAPDTESHLRLVIGRTYASMGLFAESERQLVLARKLALEFSTGETEESIAPWIELASLFRLSGRNEEAERGLRECLRAVRENLGEKHLFVSLVLNAQAAMERDRGNFIQAESMIRDALRIAEEIRAPPEESATFMNDLSLVLQDLGRMEDAIEWQKRAISVFREVLGPSHANTAIGLYNLAGLTAYQRDFAKAQQLYEQALQIFRAAGGSQSLQVAATLDSLGRLYARQKQYSLAAQHHRDALAIRRSTLHPDHVKIANSLNNLALCQFELGDPQEARALFDQALEIYQREYGDDHPVVASIFNNLAGVAWVSGDLAMAADYMNRALEVHAHHLPPEHPQLASSRHNLGCVLEELRQYDQAESQLRQALDSRTASLGQDHADTASTMNTLASVLRHQGRLPEAEQLARQAMEIRKKQFPSDSIEVAESLRDLSAILSASGRGEEALDMADEALRIAMSALPPAQWKRGVYHSNRGRVLAALGHYAEAEKAFEAAYWTMEAKLGRNNYRVIEVQEQVASMFEQLEQPELAEQWKNGEQLPAANAPGSG